MNKQIYCKRLSQIKKEYKGQDSKKKALIVMLDAQYAYSESMSKSTLLTSPKPEIGFDMGRIDNSLARAAIEEVMQCCHSMNLRADSYSNMRFYINTPYFSRTEDVFTCYNLHDPAVQNIVSIVKGVLEEQDPALTRPASGTSNPILDPGLNIIVRCYWDNHTLSFHKDRKEFGEHIYGVVLCNTAPDSGIILRSGKASMMLDESQPTWWHLQGASRWEYEHGYCAPIKPPNYGRDPVRISISFRYYQNLNQIPSPSPRH